MDDVAQVFRDRRYTECVEGEADVGDLDYLLVCPIYLKILKQNDFWFDSEAWAFMDSPGGLLHLTLQHDFFLVVQ